MQLDTWHKASEFENVVGVQESWIKALLKIGLIPSLVTSLVSGVTKPVTKLISEKCTRFLKQIKA